MKTKLLATQGQGYFYETEYECPEAFDDGVIVRNIMTGVCTSDVAMMQGDFGPLPLHMQGHEGLGQVIAVGNNVYGDVKIGDYVATRGEPAYADRYPVRENEYVVVPEADPRYIIEPVACGINIVEMYLMQIMQKTQQLDGGDPAKILIIGSGFLAYVAYRTLILDNIKATIDVVGSSNRNIWQQEGVTLKNSPSSNYGIVIVLKEDHNFLEQADIIDNNGMVIDAVGRSISKKESENLLWRAVDTYRPSPRTPIFHSCMTQAVEWIRTGELKVDNFWSRQYNRTTEWQHAFQDGMNRPPGYSRGYIVW